MQHDHGWRLTDLAPRRILHERLTQSIELDMPRPSEQRPNDAATPRGDQTRQRLLQAAVDIFGRQSFDSTTTRHLADAAGVNLSAIPYYFGGKQGLYLAVAEEIARRLHQRLQPLVDETREMLAQTPPPNREQVLAQLRRFIETFSRTLVGDSVRPAQISFIVHEQLKPTDAFDLIYRQAMHPVHGTLGLLIARLLDLPAEEDSVILHTHAIIGQTLGFVMTRSTLLRRLGREELDNETREHIVKTVTRMSVAAFTATNNE